MDGLVVLLGLTRVVAGDREEHLVEARLRDADRRDRHAGLTQADQHVGGHVGVVERHVHPARLGREHGLSAGDAADDLPGQLLIGPVRELQLQRRVSDRALQLVRSALGDLAPLVDDRDPVGQLVGLVEILGGEQDRAAVGDQAADRVPHLAAGARVKPRRRLVEEDQRRPRDQAGRQVQAPAHAPRELRDRLVGRVAQVELLEQPGGSGASVRRAHALQASEQPQVLGRGQVIVDRCVLPGHPEQLADAMGLARDVHAEHLGVPRVDRQQRGEHPQHRRLSGPVRAEDAEDLALANLEVDPVDGAKPAERLDQPRGVNSGGCHLVASFEISDLVRRER